MCKLPDLAVLPALTFVIGGASSGKSAFAEELVTGSCHSRTYIATGQAFDSEMATKIERHQAARKGAGWVTIEEPVNLSAVLLGLSDCTTVLIDCATLWLTNLMMNEADIEFETSQLLEALKQSPHPVVLVSNEVGQGVVPDNRLARQFREEQGALNLALAQQAGLVIQVTVGLPQVLKHDLPAGRK